MSLIPGEQYASRLVAATLFVGTFFFRLLEPTFHNDHFEFFALATEMRHGAIPGVDFFDPSRPLQYSLTAFGLSFGHQLLVEAMIAASLLAAGGVLVFLLGARLTRSRLFGVFPALVVTAALPRLYAYPKILVPALGLLVLNRYFEQPTRARLAAVSLTTVLAFYFRFDYLAWLACATVTGLTIVHWHDRARLARAVGAYAITAALLCGPYLLFQVVAGGILTSGPSTGRLTRVLQGEDVVAFERFRIPSDGPLVSFRPAGPLTNVRWTPAVTDAQRIELERKYRLHPVRLLDAHAWQYVMTDVSPATLKALMAEPAVDGQTNIDDQGHVVREPVWVMLARWLHVPIAESPALTRENAAIYLYSVLFFTPLVAAAVAVRRATTRRSQVDESATIAAVVVLAALFNVFMIRGNIDSRLPDVLVPNALLWAWLAWVFAGMRRRVVTIATVVAVWSLLVALNRYSGALDHLAATDLLTTPIRTARQLKYAVTGLLDPLDRFAPPGSTGLRALVRYVHRCTAPEDRLLILGYQPEFFFYSERRIAGGNVVYQANLGAAPEQQASIVARLARQRVPVAILPLDRLFDIESTYAPVKRYVDNRYAVAKESGFGEGRVFRVLVDRQVVPDHIDPELELPCFAPAATHPAAPTGSTELR